MNKAGGYISIYRQITEWEWYKDTATKSLFLHLLVTANFTDTRFMGKTIKRGQVVTSLPSLSEETGLSIRQIRTAINHLISTGEVTNKSYTKYRVISIVNYDVYQDNRQTDRQTSDRQSTVKRQTSDSQTTDNRQHHNKNNNANNANKGKKREGTFVPPTLEEVQSYVREKGFRMDAGAFFDHFSASGWVMKGGQKIKDWKAAVRNWERREKDGFGRTGGQQQGTKRVDYSYLPD